MMRVALVGLAALVLASCATLNEDECRAGDWRGIGFADGAEGRAPAFISEHRKACADFGITPDLAAWQDGREQGLRAYCTPQKAYSVGRRGRDINPVCTPEEMALLRAPNMAGQRYYEIGQRIDDVEDRLRDIGGEIADLSADQTAAKGLLRAEAARLRAQIIVLRTQRLRYDSWP